MNTKSKPKNQKSKKGIFIIISIILILFIIMFFLNKEEENKISEPIILADTTVITQTPIIDDTIENYQIGSTIKFGRYNWLILDIVENRAKIISLEILEKRQYHDTDTPITWASSNIRSYLNNDFYDSFNDDEKARIIATTINNEDNLWFGINAGPPTDDNIFLLSISEVVKYLGDSEQLIERPRNARIINDQYNEKRIASYNEAASWWWLRSPGSFGFRAARVDSDGSIDMSSNHIYDTDGGIRPAMWFFLNTEEKQSTQRYE